jgi:hypothetical protein
VNFDVKHENETETSQDKIEAMRIHKGQLFDFENEEILTQTKKRQRNIKTSMECELEDE